jgi:hypothetical protein
MVQIFVSHSKYDKDIRASFDTVFARTGVKSVCMEFEQMRSPEWQEIKNAVNSSEAVFLLLGQNVRRSIHTQNWIAFEVGLACAFSKDVWVFEQEGSNIKFPIPYLTDYMIYNLENQRYFNYVRMTIEGYGRSAPILPPLKSIRRKRGIPEGMGVSCRKCEAEFSIHAMENNIRFRCPSCCASRL